MSEVLTRAEIEEKYKGEWVLVGNPDWDEQSGVKSGVVICHSKDYHEFNRQEMALDPHPAWSGVLHLGDVPEHILV